MYDGTDENSVIFS